MKLLKLAIARQNLKFWLRQALKGEDIGVMIDGTIVKFQPVKVYSENYASLEYGVSDVELHRFVQRINQELDAERKAGHLKPFRGS